MSYAALERKIKSIPEDCLDDIADYIEYVLFRWKKKSEQKAGANLGKYFGSMAIRQDGLKLQKGMRDEWS